MPVGAQPADEFEGRLREALERLVNLGQGLPLGCQNFFLLGQPFLFSLGFGGVGHALLFVAILHQQQQIMHEGHEMGLHFLGGDARRPGFLLLQFGLGFVKHFLDFPPGFIEQHQQSRFQGHFRSQLDIDLAVTRIFKGDFPHQEAAPVFDHPIALDALIDRLGQI